MQRCHQIDDPFEINVLFSRSIWAQVYIMNICPNMAAPLKTIANCACLVQSDFKLVHTHTMKDVLIITVNDLCWVKTYQLQNS